MQFKQTKKFTFMYHLTELTSSHSGILIRFAIFNSGILLNGLIVIFFFIEISKHRIKCSKTLDHMIVI